MSVLDSNTQQRLALLDSVGGLPQLPSGRWGAGDGPRDDAVRAPDTRTNALLPLRGGRLLD